AARMMVAWGRLLADHALISAATGVAAVSMAVWVVQRSSTRRWFEQRVWRSKLLGERLRVYYLARLYRALGMLLRGGMSGPNALALAGGVLEPGLRAKLADAATRIREGEKISLAMEEHGLATPVARRMLLVGERSGAMGEMMERIATFYEDD